MGNSHPVVVAYDRFLRLCVRFDTRLESDLDNGYVHLLGPALMVFHVQLEIRNWLVCQLDVAETEHLSPPDLCQGVHPPCWPSVSLHEYWHAVEREAEVIVPEQTMVVLERPPTPPLVAICCEAILEPKFKISTGVHVLWGILLLLAW
jgi:hypothetical protein